MAALAHMMGSGPRTHPGGISDREWRRNQRREVRSMEKAWQERQRAQAAERLASFRSLARRLKDQNEGEEEEDEHREVEGVETLQAPCRCRFLTQDGQMSHRFLPPHASFSTRLYRKVLDPDHPCGGEPK